MTRLPLISSSGTKPEQVAEEEETNSLATMGFLQLITTLDGSLIRDARSPDL